MGDKKLIPSSASSSSTSIYDTTRSSNNHHHHQPPPSSSDEISQFLRHIFDRSSPLPSYYYSPAMTTTSTAAIGVQGEPHADNPRCYVSTPASKRAAAEFSDVLLGSAVGSGSATAAAGCYGFLSGNNNIAQGSSSGTRVSSSSLGASGNDTDEYDCESEEGVEAVVDGELPSKSRSSSKRCRAAEVHNLSEKRRRSRINEKMKALQSLIPNSNKVILVYVHAYSHDSFFFSYSLHIVSLILMICTISMALFSLAGKTDKASMLDEAIEYLKQLQLQVQMLTMRNGINLHPLSLPGTSLHPLQLSQIRPPETTSDPLLNHQFASTSNAPEMINMPSPYTLEPSIRSHFGPFLPFTPPPVEMSREGGLTHQRLNTSHPSANLTGEHAAFDEQHPEIKDRLT